MKTPSCADYNVPQHTQAAIVRFVEHGYMPGGFLTALLTNNLFLAVDTADRLNKAAIPEIVRWVFNNLPLGAYGTEDKMMDWCRKVQAEFAAQEA